MQQQLPHCNQHDPAYLTQKKKWQVPELGKYLDPDLDDEIQVAEPQIR